MMYTIKKTITFFEERSYCDNHILVAEHKTQPLSIKKKDRPKIENRVFKCSRLKTTLMQFDLFGIKHFALLTFEATNLRIFTSIPVLLKLSLAVFIALLGQIK